MENDNLEVTKSEEQIREEVRKELEREQEIKEEAKQELKEQQKQEEMREYESKRKRRSIGKIIWRVITSIIIIFLLFEIIMGVLDMQRINEDKDPVWYISSKVEEKDGTKETTYDLGLYVIVKSVNKKESRTFLKPFFLK